MMQVYQELITINDHGAEYSNFFAYGHETRRMLSKGYIVKHIHDDPQRRTAWVLYEKQVDPVLQTLQDELTMYRIAIREKDPMGFIEEYKRRKGELPMP